MGLSDFKFKETDFAGKKIADLSDTPSSDGMTAANLKDYFDYIPKAMIALGTINSLLDEMARIGLDNAVISTGSGQLKYIRISDDGTIETSSDGVKYTKSGDMKTSTYDINGNGIVDNSEKLGGHTPEYFAKARDIPSMDGYATQQWVEMKGYINEHQHLKTINNQNLTGDGNINIGGSGTTDHDQLQNRDKINQHPLSAITGLEEDLNNKVEKVEGKGLSSNDYTDEEKAKLANAITEHQDISGKADKPTVLTGTLTAGQTSITLTDAAIATTSIIDIYTDVYGLSPDSVTVVNGSVTLVFPAQTVDVSVRVEVR